ncbi:hypothetical protein FHG87_024508, partial [Trinorchestia longiramus]
MKSVIPWLFVVAVLQLQDKGGMASIVKGIKALLGDVEMAPYTVVKESE